MARRIFCFPWEDELRPLTRFDVALLAGLALTAIVITTPFVLRAREVSRTRSCADNLRVMFVGMINLTDRNQHGLYCNGAYDPWRDGRPDEIGWVADIVNTKFGRPQELLCPSNPAQASEGLIYLLGALGDDAEAADKNYGHASKKVAAKPPAVMTCTPQEVADRLLARGYGTNYSASWLLVRTQPTLKSVVVNDKYRLLLSERTYYPKNSPFKARHTTLGPLKRRFVDMSPIATRLLPLLGDGGTTQLQRSSPVDVVGSDGREYLRIGTPLIDSFSEGPTERTQNKPWHLLGRDIEIRDFPKEHLYLLGDEQPRDKALTRYNRQANHLQDFRNFAPVHAGEANILFADGSVRRFRDVNGDGLLNPGFEEGRTEPNLKPYADDRIELPAAEIFSGILLWNWQYAHAGHACG